MKAKNKSILIGFMVIRYVLVVAFGTVLAWTNNSAAAQEDLQARSDRPNTLMVEATTAQEQKSKPDAYVLSNGDTVKVRFYKYADLSGDFLLRDDGTISVPLLGTVSLSGKTVADAEASLAAALSALTLRKSYVSVEISKYRPIYVVGYVEHAGSFSWTPDLFVLQAVGLAGGFPRVPDNLAADKDREAGQLTKSAELIARAIIRRDRLLSERDWNPKLELSKELAEIVPVSKAQEIWEGEQRLLERNIQIRDAHKQNIKRMVALADDEVQALSRRLTAVQSEIDIKNDMANTLRNLLTKGNTTVKNVSDIESEVARLKSEEGQLLAEVSQAKQRLNTATFDLDRNDKEILQDIERDLAEIDREIARNRAEIATSKTVLKRYGGTGCPSGVGPAGVNVAYQIVRKSDLKVETIEAEETTAVRPGDTVRVQLLATPCSK